MHKPPIILIADRNPFVRKFLEREIGHVGYRVRLAENSRQVIFWKHPADSPDLVVIDPDLPGADANDLLADLQRRAPNLPVVIHCHAPEEFSPPTSNKMWFVEKHGNSIEKLIQIVGNLLGAPPST